MNIRLLLFIVILFSPTYIYSYDMTAPIDKTMTIVSDLGPRNAGSRASTVHHGLDINFSESPWDDGPDDAGLPLKAVEPGTITKIHKQGGLIWDIRLKPNDTTSVNQQNNRVWLYMLIPALF